MEPKDPKNLHLDQILTVSQMRAAEDALMARGVSVHELMERAGKGAADWVWRIAAGQNVTVFCGPGNNGGDGYVIAEAIRARGGTAIVIEGATPVTAACQAAKAKFQGMILPMGSKTAPGVFVDCLFGSGLTRPLSKAHLAEMRRFNGEHKLSIAIDLPSGVDADSGAKLNEDIPAFHLCIALGAWKNAHFLQPAASISRSKRLVDIGIHAANQGVFRLGIPKGKAPDSAVHKYSRGYVAVIGGKMGGAAMLSAKAAMRLAGYVALVGGKSRGPDALVHRRWEDVADDARVGAMLVGPGLGRDTTAYETLAQASATAHPLVLDADALMITSHDAIAALNRPVILTPHEGEFTALFGRRPGNKVDRARAAAQSANAVVVLKGADTVVAAPDGEVRLADPAPGWLASAGTGDVLAGLCAAALAESGDPFRAACTAVWLHAEAARIAGPALIADDLPRCIPQAIAATL